MRFNKISDSQNTVCQNETKHFLSQLTNTEEMYVNLVSDLLDSSTQTETENIGKSNLIKTHNNTKNIIKTNKNQ